jgi:hypothetical protein
MVNKPNSNAAKNILWPGATPFWALVSRQNPFGLRGSLPATVNWLRCLQFVFRRVSRKPLLPTFVGKSCQNIGANLARSCCQFLPQI